MRAIASAMHEMQKKRDHNNNNAEGRLSHGPVLKQNVLAIYNAN